MTKKVKLLDDSDDERGAAAAGGDLTIQVNQAYAKRFEVSEKNGCDAGRL